MKPRTQAAPSLTSRWTSSISRCWTVSASSSRRLDPMPPDLPERIRFSLALRDLEIEVARIAAEEDQRLVARPRRGAEPDDHLR